MTRFLAIICLLSFSFTPGTQAADAKFVDASCSPLVATSLSETIQNSFRQGLSCLSKLNTPVAKKHFDKLNDILNNKSKPLNVRCENDASESQWAGHTIAYVYMDKKQNNTIHINTKPFFSQSNIKQQNTILHESFHLMGLSHGSEVDYPYACGFCCFGSGEAKELGCKICSGTFEKVADPQYQRTLKKLAEADGYTPVYPEQPLRAFLKNPSDPDLIKWFFMNLDIHTAFFQLALVQELKLPEEHQPVAAFDGAETFQTLSEKLANAFRIYMDGNLESLVESFAGIEKEYYALLANAPNDKSMAPEAYNKHLEDTKDIYDTLKYAASYSTQDLAKSAKNPEEKKRLEALANRLIYPWD